MPEKTERSKLRSGSWAGAQLPAEQHQKTKASSSSSSANNTSVVVAVAVSQEQELLLLLRSRAAAGRKCLVRSILEIPKGRWNLSIAGAHSKSLQKEAARGPSDQGFIGWGEESAGLRSFGIGKKVEGEILVYRIFIRRLVSVGEGAAIALSILRCPYVAQAFVRHLLCLRQVMVAQAKQVEQAKQPKPDDISGAASTA